jgi:ribosomal subunit interface protein
MQTPIHITFHELPHSEAVEAHVRKHAAKLEEFSGRIIACHVVLEGPHRHEHRGRDHRVRVHLVVPRGEIVVSHPTGDDSTEDLYAAIDGAFDRVGRRLEDHVRRQRGDVKAHESGYREGRATKLGS